MSDLLVIDDNNYAFITTNFFYLVDGSGTIRIRKELKQGVYSQLESMIRDGEANFWISSTVFMDVNTSQKVLYKLSANGQSLTTVTINDPVPFEYIKLAPAANNHFFLSYKARGPSGNAAIRVALLDKNGNRVWEKQSSDTISNNYSFKSGPNNSADIFYQHIVTRQGEIVNINAAGNITTKIIQLADPADADYYTSDFHRANDGFIFTGVAQRPWPLYTDGVIYKTDANGNTAWVKNVSLRLGDNLFGVTPVADGYIVLGSSGTTNAGNDAEGDIVLLKFDLSGNQIWTRAFGGAKMDYARHLRVLNQHIIFAGQSSYPAQSVSVPVLCKTNMNGEFAVTLPFQPEPAASMKVLEMHSSTSSVSLVQSAPGADGSILSGGNELDPADDRIYPFITRNDKDGKQVWYKRLSDHAAPLKVFKQIRPGEYIAVAEIKDLFTNVYEVYLLNVEGKIIWKKDLRANGLKDVIGTSDGGILFTGAADISFVNYEVLVIKLDGAGNQQWLKTIGEVRVWETGHKVVETPEQDFLIVGNAQREYDVISSLFVLKIDRNGNKRWAKTFAGGVTTDLGYDVILTPDHGYLFAGATNKQPFTNKNVLLLKTDKDGNIAWKKTHDLHLMDEGFRVINSKENGFMIIGTTADPGAGVLEKFVFVMRTDASGNSAGANYFGKPGLQTMNPSLTVSSFGDTILTGTSQERYGKEYLFTTKLNDLRGEDPAGDPQEGSVILYPNPSQGSSVLRITQPETGSVFISIYDQGGKKIKDFYQEKTGATFRRDLVIPGLSAGVYYVNVWLNG